MLEKFIATAGVASVLALAGSASAQPAPGAAPAWNPPPARAQCTLTPQQVEANRQLAMSFFRPGVTPAERTAMLHPDYVQHNPRFKQFAQQRGLSDYAAFPQMLAQLQGGGAGGPPQNADAPRPPPGNPLALVSVDCDLVTILHQVNLQVPGAAPGTWYQAFNFDTFRVRDGKFVEHWDQQVIPPAAAGPPGGGARPPA